MSLPIAHFLVPNERSGTYGSGSDAILRACDNVASSGVIRHTDDQPALALQFDASAPGAPLMPCENCGGEGGFPEPHGEWGMCPCCEGTGEVASSDRELISLDDLDRIDREKPVDAYVDN